MHTPVSVTDEAIDHARNVRADCLVAMGGGSTIGLAKAIALRTGLPQIVLPTTYAGSEATHILGQTENGVKSTLTDPKVQPEVVLYDAELVVSLPTGLSVNSALNAIAHAVEALYARDRSAATTELALSGIAAFIDALPTVLTSPQDVAAREMTLRGAWACGSVLGQVGMALHHKLCHTLGGTFGLPHAETHAIILPHATHYNAEVVPDLLAPISSLLDGSPPGKALWTFSKGLGAPTSLRDLGMIQSDLDRAASVATENPYWNPRDVKKESIRELLDAAFHGEAPST